MNPVDLIVTICAVLSPVTCEETHLVFSWSGSLQQCAMGAPPYIAQWVREHPKLNAVNWHCNYPHAHDKADASRATPAGSSMIWRVRDRATCCSPSNPCRRSKIPHR